MGIPIAVGGFHLALQEIGQGCGMLLGDGDK
jgi:hypothetical protein